MGHTCVEKWHFTSTYKGLDVKVQDAWTPHPTHASLKRTTEVSRSEMDSQIQISKIRIQPLWLCIRLRLYSSLHYITLKYCFRNIFLPKILFFFFFNCTLLQTTACNGVKHHRNNAGIQQKSSCLSTTSNKNTLTFCWFIKATESKNTY